MSRLRGARPSPRSRLAGTAPHKVVGETPPQFLWVPSQLSMWLNDVDGDCVTAEEAAAKAMVAPQVFITVDTVLAWATNNAVLGGAELTQVMDFMQSAGFLQDGNTYNDGKFTAVDWTNAEVLQNAIAQGPVKIGVAADQLENAVGPNDPIPNGWFATGFTADASEDHCVNLCGFGTISWLAEQLGVTVPEGVDGTQQGYALFTWGSVGIIDVPSMRAITAEAWLRNPTTVVAQAE